MNTPLDISLKELWAKAKAAKVGISINTSDRNLLRQQLHRYKYESKDMTLDQFIISFTQNEGELVIVRKTDASPSRR